MRQSPGFANMFQASVAEGLANTLGAIVMQTLKSVLSYSFEAYAEKPSELHRELSGVCGSGATTLERMITKQLFRGLDLRYSNDFDFDACFNPASHSMSNTQVGTNCKERP